MPKKNAGKIKVKVVPITGSPTTYEVDAPGELTAEAVLTAAGVASDQKALSVRRTETLTLDPGDTVKPGETLTVTERPQGS